MHIHPSAKNILITGATGNVGQEVIKYLYTQGTSDAIIAGVRSIGKAQTQFKEYPNLHYAQFDFDDIASYTQSFKNIHTLFLLRPPHISNVKKYFEPLIAAAKECGVSQIVFLSVQGVETSTIIPHNKIEKLILTSGIDHIFVRPSYFMQNLTSTLAKDLHEKKQIILPAGNAKFNWVDVENIGEACARFLNDFPQYRNQAYEITGTQNESFQTVTNIINQVAGQKIIYRSLNPVSYFLLKKREGVDTGLIMVMIMLHFLPRFQKEPKISDVYEKLTGKKPMTIKGFIEREIKKFTL